MKKLFVLVRKDLKRSSPAVQAGHAVAQFLIDYPDCDWNNNYLIYLRVPDLESLVDWKSKIGVSGNTLLKYATFSEPDLNNELTAIAVYGADSLFSNLRLL